MKAEMIYQTILKDFQDGQVFDFHTLKRHGLSLSPTDLGQALTRLCKAGFLELVQPAAQRDSAKFCHRSREWDGTEYREAIHYVTAQVDFKEGDFKHRALLAEQVRKRGKPPKRSRGIAFWAVWENRQLVSAKKIQLKCGRKGGRS